MIINLNTFSAKAVKDLDTQLQKNNAIVLLHATWCHWCKQFKPEWNKFAQEYKATSKIAVVEVEHSALELLKDKHTGVYQKLVGNDNIGFPTVLLFKNGQKFTYKGDRTSQSLKEHLTSFVPELKQVKAKKRVAKQQEGGSSKEFEEKLRVLVSDMLRRKGI